jgi:nucleoside-diphosphate-sugar epimerase
LHVCITGANGFLGSHFVNHALAQGHQVSALIRPNAKIDHLPQHDQLQMVTMDYHQPEQTLRNLKAKSGLVDVFIHNAGSTIALKPDEYYESNTSISKMLCDALLKTELLDENGIIIYISSYAAYGPGGKPISHYGRSKLKAEEYIIESGIKYKIFRPTAVYGPGDQAFQPLLFWMQKGIFPILGTRHQKITLIYAPSLVATVFRELYNKPSLNFLCDGKVYLPEDLKQAGAQVYQRKIRMIQIPSWLIKMVLRISDLTCRIFNIKPFMTLEKYREITSDWDLNKDPSLFHPEVIPKIDIVSGFSSVVETQQKVR